MMRSWISLLLMPLMAQATTIEVFKTSQMTLNDTGLRLSVCDVDEYQKLTSTLTQEFKNKAYETFSLTQIAPQIARIEKAAKCLQSMFELNVKKLPAIVFNKKQVVYGEFDVHAALSFLKRLEKNL